MSEVVQETQTLEWIGFSDRAQHARLTNSTLVAQNVILEMSEKDYTELSALFSRRIVTNRKIDFGAYQAKKFAQLSR